MARVMKVVDPRGMHGEVQVTDNGWFCPVCGQWVSGRPAWKEDGRATLDECPSCDTMFGADDHFKDRQDLNELWSRLRIAWLHEHAWRPELLERLRQNLGLDRSALEREVDAYNSDREYLSARAKGAWISSQSLPESSTSG